VYVNFYAIIFIGGIGFALFLIYFIISPRRLGAIGSKSQITLILGVFILAFALGAFRFHVVDKPAPESFESKVGQEISFSGVLVDEPNIGEKNQKLNIGAEEGEERTEILITVNFGENFEYGDEVSVSGILEKPENFVTDSGKDFDYVNYLRKDGIFYVMGYPDIEIISQDNGSKIKSVLFDIKNKFLEKINFAIPNPESLLMGGLILGERSAFSSDQRQDFVRTGTIHIIALSGYNITIVAEWFMKLFAFLPQGLAVGAGIFAILLFILMTGGSSTAVRAGIMATLALFARATGRNYDAGRILVLAGALMIVFNPFLLVYDVSFQLSFIATVAVIFLAPRIEKYFQWITKRFGLRDIVSVTVAAYIFVLPFILYKMGNLSLVALPANILILPLIPFTMVLGFFTGFVGFIWSALSLPFGFISYLLLHYELGVISILSNLSFASFSIPNFPLVLTILIYAYFTYRLFGRNIALFFKLK
jgi:competence protein ComEC